MITFTMRIVTTPAFAILHTDYYYCDNRETSLYVQRRARIDVGHVFGVKTNPYLKIKYHLRSFINLL